MLAIWQLDDETTYSCFPALDPGDEKFGSWGEIGT